MEYLQYEYGLIYNTGDCIMSFKPYYKWNTFNTNPEETLNGSDNGKKVLNLIINGIPSIL